MCLHHSMGFKSEEKSGKNVGKKIQNEIAKKVVLNVIKSSF